MAVLVEEGGHYEPGEPRGVHVRVGDQGREHPGVVVPVRRYERLGPHQDVAVLLDLVEHLQLGHETLVEAQPVQGDVRAPPGLLECLPQLVGVDNRAGGVVVAGAVAPSPAVAPDVQVVPVGGVAPDGPDHEVPQLVGVPHVHLAHVLQELAVEDVRVTVGEDVVPACGRPVPVGLVPLGGPVQLEDYVDVVGGAHRLHLVEVEDGLVLEIVVRRHVDHVGPLGIGPGSWGRALIAPLALQHRVPWVRVCRREGRRGNGQQERHGHQDGQRPAGPGGERSHGGRPGWVQWSYGGSVFIHFRLGRRLAHVWSRGLLGPCLVPRPAYSRRLMAVAMPTAEMRARAT